MTRFTYINQNIDRIKYEVKIGLISPTVIKYWEMYSRFDYYRKLGNSVNMSIFYAGEDLSIKDRLAFRIKKQMESPI